jgi:cell division septation protein DedD
VQIGALTNDATAKRFWSRLEKRHAALLEGKGHRIFGPAEVGGSLHHLRIGPMTEEGAAGLCAELQAEGVDCFEMRVEVGDGGSRGGDVSLR